MNQVDDVALHFLGKERPVGGSAEGRRRGRGPAKDFQTGGEHIHSAGTEGFTVMAFLLL